MCVCVCVLFVFVCDSIIVNNMVSASNSQLIAAVSVAEEGRPEEDSTEQYPGKAVVDSSALCGVDRLGHMTHSRSHITVMITPEAT